MKTFIRVLIIIVALVMIPAGTVVFIEKYAKCDVSYQMQQVDKVNISRKINWQVVDDQSLIISTGPRDYYLVTLKTASPELPYGERVWITEGGSAIRANLDKVLVSDGTHLRSSYLIEGIYRIECA